MFTVNPPLDKPDLTAPVNDPVNVINTSRPVYSWKVVARATSYAITVQGATKYAKTYTAASICDATTCNVDPGVTLKAGLHTWMIKASNKAGSSVSATATFYAPIPALTPIIVGLVSPKNKAKLANADLTSLTWNSVSNASDYLVVITGKGFSYSKILSKDIASCADSSILTCSTPDLPTLGYGTYTWNVTAIDLGVYGKQSVPYSFTLVLSAPNVQEVWGITQAKLVFSWDRQSDATRYDLLVTTTDIKPKTMYKASVTPGSVCDSATCAVTIPTFATGNYIWTITGYNPASGSGKIQNESFETYPLLDSEFNDVNDMEGWADIGLASSSVGSGKWRMVGNSNAWSYGAISSYPNTDFQANLTRYGCNSCAQGIVIHGTFVPNDATDGYLQYGYQFLITNDGYFSVWRIDNYRASWLLPWKSTTAIKKGSVQNTLRVMANHNIIYFYINSSLVWVGFDSTYPSEPLGQIGMGMYQDDSNGNILTIDRAVNYDSLELQLMPDTMNAQKSQNGIAAESSPDLNESPKGFIPK
jgi:hypothetical protein